MNGNSDNSQHYTASGFSTASASLQATSGPSSDASIPRNRFMISSVSERKLHDSCTPNAYSGDSAEICGFLKAIFIPDIRCLYIAYLVTAPGSDHAEGPVAQELVSRLFAACRDSAIQSVVYEICAEPKSSQEAKDRLFRHYASVYGVKLRHINAKYQQPEICSFDSGDCKLTNAKLYIARLGNQLPRTCDIA